MRVVNGFRQAIRHFEFLENQFIQRDTEDDEEEQSKLEMFNYRQTRTDFIDFDYFDSGRWLP